MHRSGRDVNCCGRTARSGKHAKACDLDIATVAPPALINSVELSRSGAHVKVLCTQNVKKKCSYD